jgi:hypothetical protein
VAGNVKGAEQLVVQFLSALDQRLHESRVSLGIWSEARRRLLDGSVQRARPAAVERVGEGDLGVRELDAELIHRDRPHERRCERQRMDRGTDVVHDPGRGELRGAASSADRGGGFVDDDRAARARDLDAGGEAVRPRPDDYRVVMRFRRISIGTRSST